MNIKVSDATFLVGTRTVKETYYLTKITVDILKLVAWKPQLSNSNISIEDNIIYICILF